MPTAADVVNALDQQALGLTQFAFGPRGLLGEHGKEGSILQASLWPWPLGPYPALTVCHETRVTGL